MAERCSELPVSRIGITNGAEGWVPRTEQQNREYFYSVAETKVGTKACRRNVSPAQPGRPCLLRVLRVVKGALRADQSWSSPREVTPSFKREKADSANAWLCGSFHINRTEVPGS